jgi:Mn-dependent DtxR family transcriptional regulator
MPIPRTKTHTEDQVLAILTYCERAGNNSPNTVWGLAKRTGVPYQTVYCYLRELEEEGPRIVKIRGKVKLQSGIAQLEKYAEKHHLRIKYNKNWQDNKQPVLRVFLRADEGPRN